MPAGLGAIGFYYTDFHQVSDAEVTDILARASQPSERKPAASDQAAKETTPEPTAGTR